MDVSTRFDKDVVIVTLAGELTLDVTDQFRTAIAAFFDQPARGIIIDAGGLEYIDSSGLGALVSAQTTLARKNRPLVLANVSKKVAEIMRITKLDRLFIVADSVAAARARLTGA
jgi:anti-sigma B factor antagonist